MSRLGNVRGLSVWVGKCPGVSAQGEKLAGKCLGGGKFLGGNCPVTGQMLEADPESYIQVLNDTN